jgi:hypothetical protein
MAKLYANTVGLSRQPLDGGMEKFMIDKGGRPRKFFTEEELITAKKLLKYMLVKPKRCSCGNNMYTYGFYNNGAIVARCMACGYRKYYKLMSGSWE